MRTDEGVRSGTAARETAPAAIPPPAPLVSHWPDLARRWAELGPPLRPSPEDIGLFADVVARWQGPVRGLILGVTPELYRLPWPRGSHLLAVDRTRGMIDAVWPGPPGTVVQADWRALPLASSSRDVVLCDGGLVQLPYPAGVAALARGLRRIMSPGGVCAIRLFVPPAKPESPDDVLRDLLAGRVANLNVLKLRLAMAMYERSRGGIRLDRIWEVVHRVAPDPERLAARIGWNPGALRGIDVYRDCAARYHFPGIDAVRREFRAAGFDCENVRVPQYVLGERCPTATFRRAK